jgi:hypothetical protein
VAGIIIAPVSGAEAQDPLTVLNPFATQLTHDNISKCEAITQPQFNELSKIDTYSYTFTPPNGGDGSPNGPDVQVARRITFPLSEIDIGKVTAAIHTLDQNSCEVDIKVSIIDYQVPSRDKVTLSYHVDGELSDCGWFLGIHYRNWMADGSANVHIGYHLDNQLNLVSDEGLSL